MRRGIVDVNERKGGRGKRNRRRQIKGRKTDTDR
jgi:hypothetical protein